MEKIKPCPHCGGEAELDVGIADPYEGELVISVKCKTCGAHGKGFPVNKDPHETGDWDIPECASAIDSWNLRKNSEYEDLLVQVFQAIADLKTICRSGDETN